MKRAVIALMVGAATSLAVSAPAQADPDTDFANELHTYGIYGQKDYNAWIGKLACKRLHNGVDHSAQDSAKFVSDQLQKGATTEQAWQFLGGAINYYCPDQRVVLEHAAAGN
ncbi:putative membrane protein [Mycobacterium frederiksbergense]|uniref:Membrane protein n=1 Tax=Mycolicibacterium frederiksbergense TaxID=117567 RepID=A0ABT6L6Y4_9MYCO|nr:DUF732 domain-containing protein [Mycolicibacterium frederiksbergense]MDH6198719.1 putative membrane protein [Mycolicibacterium frederiksbergense]